VDANPAQRSAHRSRYPEHVIAGTPQKHYRSPPASTHRGRVRSRHPAPSRPDGGLTIGPIDDCEAAVSETSTPIDDEEAALLQRIAEAGWTPMDETDLPMTANVKLRFQPGSATYYTGAMLRSSYGKTRIEALRQFVRALSEERETKRRK
jgi:hypothetical protein